MRSVSSSARCASASIASRRAWRSSTRCSPTTAPRSTAPYYHLAEAMNNPKPVQARIPMCIGGVGRRRTIPLVARHADHWNYGGSDPDEFAELRSVLHEACASIGREPERDHVQLPDPLRVRRRRSCAPGSRRWKRRAPIWRSSRSRSRSRRRSSSESRRRSADRSRTGWALGWLFLYSFDSFSCDSLRRGSWGTVDVRSSRTKGVVHGRSAGSRRRHHRWHTRHRPRHRRGVPRRRCAGGHHRHERREGRAGRSRRSIDPTTRCSSRPTSSNEPTANGPIDEAVARFGKVDILVNNAGGASNHAPVADLTDEAFEDALRWNLWSTFWSSAAMR